MYDSKKLFTHCKMYFIIVVDTQELLLQLESECLGDSAALFTSPQSEGDSRTVILVLGQHVHRLPWECLSTLKGLTVTRMPSLAFASAHKTLVNICCLIGKYVCTL